MRDKEIAGALEKIRAILDEVLIPKKRPTRKGASGGPSKSSSRPPRSSSALPDHLQRLRDAGFFKQPKTAVEAHAKLQPTYHCDVNRVAMALLRLWRKRLLRKTFKVVGKRKQVAYVW